MQFNQGSHAAHALPSLLSILNSSKLRSIPPDSIVNASTINLICNLLSSEDYVSVAEQLSQDSDVKNLVDFMLHLLRDGRLPNLDETLGIKRRARRLMFKIITRIPVIPPSLIVTGVNMPEKRDYIGSGGFGRIFKGELEGAVVALKVLYKSDSNVPFCREALMWRSLTHRLVLPFLGIYELEDGTAPQFFLVSPYMTNGNLAQWRKKTTPSVAEVEERILEVAQGMEYIHSEGVVHGDLRGENILLDAKVHVQIADFGLTRLSEATNTQSGALHLNFAAPELFGFSEDGNDSEDVPARTQMSDVYAFGCLYYEIHYDSIPFAGKQDTQIWTLIFRGTLPPRLDEPLLSDWAWSVIQSCWTRAASKRPGMKDITESMLSMTQSMSLPIDAQDPFKEWFELPSIPAQTLTILRQELGIGNQDLTQMTPAERLWLWTYYQHRKPDSAGEVDGFLPMQANQELLEIQMIPAPTLAALRQEIGLSDRNLSQTTPAERRRLLAAYRQQTHMNRSIPPPMNVQQPGNTHNTSFPQLGRPPSRANTPSGQSSMLQPNPPSSARLPPEYFALMHGAALMQADQEVSELRMIPAPILAVLKQELGLSDRDPKQMTPAQRGQLLGAYRQRRKPDSAGPAPGWQPSNSPPALPRQQPQQRRLKRSNATPEETREVGRTNSSPPQKRQRPSPEQLPVQGISYPPQQPPQPQGPPDGPQPGQPGIPMPGKNTLMTMRAPPQMTGPISGGIPQAGQPPMSNPMNMDIASVDYNTGFVPAAPHHVYAEDAHYWRNMFLELGYGSGDINPERGQLPLGGPQLGASLYPQGHANQPGLMNQQQQMYRMQNLQSKGTMPPPAMNPTIQGPPNSTNPSSRDPTIHHGAPSAPGGPQFNRPTPPSKSLGMIIDASAVPCPK